MKFELKEYHRDVPDNILLDDIRRVYSAANTPLSKPLYEKNGTYHPSTIAERFGGLVNACKMAGVPYIDLKNTKIDREDLFANLMNVWIEKGDQPSIQDLSKYHSKYSIRPYYTEFKTWRNALESFVKWVNSKDLDLMPDVTTINNNTRKTNRDINLRLRFLVMKRDHFKCRICGRSPATSPGVILHIDHVIPWSRGGETVIDNLQTLCSDCNLGKSNL